MNPGAGPARPFAAANPCSLLGRSHPIEVGVSDVPWPVQDLRAFLLGSWKLDRIIIDRSRAMTGGLKGEARFSPCAGGLLYEEHGILTLGDHRGRAGQSYLYLFPEGGGRASVRFRDGRAFHELDLTRGQDRVSHPCRPDLYEGLLTVVGPASWRSEWKASGPRKDYDLLTTYSRRSPERDEDLGGGREASSLGKQVIHSMRSGSESRIGASRGFGWQDQCSS